MYGHEAYRLARRIVLNAHPICQRCGKAPSTDANHTPSLRELWRVYGHDRIQFRRRATSTAHLEATCSSCNQAAKAEAA